MEIIPAVFTHNVVPLYAEPNGSSEQISQGVLGDAVVVTGQSDAFVQVRTQDDYTGWVRTIHLRAFESRDPLQRMAEHYPAASPGTISQAFADVWESPDQSRLRTKLVWGNRITVLETVLWRTGNYALVLLPGGAYGVPASPTNPPFSLGYVRAETLAPAAYSEFDGKMACELAHRFIGTPYLWGGGTPFGFDCSGFVQRIYSVLGITLPRDAYMQARSPRGKFHEPGKSLRAGDLVFFVGPTDPRQRGITHVGLALDNRHFIHAYGKTGVTLSAFDDSEVRAAYTYRGSWRATLRRAKRPVKV